jgi:hypothetical protein
MALQAWRDNKKWESKKRGNKKRDNKKSLVQPNLRPTAVWNRDDMSSSFHSFTTASVKLALPL